MRQTFPHYIFVYLVATDLQIESLVLEIWFLNNPTEKGTLSCVIKLTKAEAS